MDYIVGEFITITQSLEAWIVLVVSVGALLYFTGRIIQELVEGIHRGPGGRR